MQKTVELAIMILIQKNIQALIFDCDGTLADTMLVHNKAWHDTCTEYGFKCKQSFLDKLAGMPTNKIVELLKQKFKLQLNSETFIKQREDRALQNLPNVHPIIPVVNIAKKYHGKLPMCVASGGSRLHVMTSLTAIGIEKLFDAIFTADDPIKPKPNPDLFLHAAKYMEVPPQHCQVFEDGQMGLLAAERAGMVTTDVRPWLNK